MPDAPEPGLYWAHVLHYSTDKTAFNAIVEVVGRAPFLDIFVRYPFGPFSRDGAEDERADPESVHLGPKIEIPALVRSSKPRMMRLTPRRRRTRSSGAKRS